MMQKKNEVFDLKQAKILSVGNNNKPYNDVQLFVDSNLKIKGNKVFQSFQVTGIALFCLKF